MSNMAAVDICNLALTRIGTLPIISLSDGTANSNKCASIYDPARRATLRDFRWNFAKTTINAAAANSEISFLNWNYAYTYPQNCLQVLSIYNQGTNPEDAFLANPIFSGNLQPNDNMSSIFEIQHSPIIGDSSKVICANCESPAYIEFIYDVIDTTLFDDYFISALGWRMAYELAPAITANVQKTQSYYKMYLQELDRAQINQGREEHKEIKRRPPSLSARGSGTIWPY